MRIALYIFGVVVLLLSANQPVLAQGGTIGTVIPECTPEEMATTARIVRPIATEIGLVQYQLATASTLTIVIQLNRLQVDLARQFQNLPRCAFAFEINANMNAILSEMIIIALSPDDLFLTLREPWSDLVMEESQKITDALPSWWPAGLDGPPDTGAVG